jgi:hypothetical protein
MSLSVNTYVGGLLLAQTPMLEPVQSHASVELPHVANPLPDLPGMYASPCCPPFALAPSLHTFALFLAENNNHYNTFYAIQNDTLPIETIHLDYGNYST